MRNGRTPSLSCNGHAREALLATVSARLRVATKSSKQREIQIKLLNEPIHICSTVAAEHLGDLWFLGAALECVGQEDFLVVWDSLLRLRFGPGTIDTEQRPILSSQHTVLWNCFEGVYLSSLVFATA